MKTRILLTGLALATTVAFGQKKEIRKAEKAIKSSKYTEAIDYLKEAEGMIGSMDNELKAQFYAARGEAILGTAGQDASKLKSAAAAFNEAITINQGIQPQIADQMHNLRSALINAAVKDQNAGKFVEAADNLFASYGVSKDPSDLYFAAGNMVNAKKYDKALEYYQMLLDMNYTGETTEFVATNKETGEVEPFESENMRNIALKTGEFIKPETRVTASRKGEILRNMTLIYIEQDQKDKAMDLMKQARSENPDDVYLMRAEADMSYNMGDIKRYNELMNKIVASDPENPEIYFNLGVGSAEIGEKEKAIEYYNKALELNPNYEAALINIAVVKLSAEDKMVEEMNKLGSTAADNKRYDELKKQREKIYAETVPYLEKALKLKPNNPEVLRTLMNIYGQLGEDAKQKEVRTKLDSLEKKG